MFEDRFFKVDAHSTTHKTLFEMENADATIMSALNIADKFHETATPVIMTMNGVLRGMSLLPYYPKWDTKGKVILEGIKQAITNNFTTLAAVLFDDRRFTPFVLPTVLGPNGQPQFVPNQNLIDAMITIAENVDRLHLDEDVLSKICKGKLISSDASYGSLISSPRSTDQVFKSDLRRIFSTWVIRLQPIRANVEEDFVPVDCTRITSQELTDLAKPAEITDFAIVRYGAQQRLLQLQKIGVPRLAPNR